MNYYPDLPYQMVVWQAPHVTLSVLQNAFKQFTTAKNLLSASTTELCQLGFSQKNIHYLHHPPWSSIETQIKWASSPDHHFVYPNDPAFPFLLMQTNQPPLKLFVRGKLDILNHPQLAIVGARRPTLHGSKTAFKFAQELSNAGFLITSGLALGIDAAAHRGAINNHHPTVAVLGSGINIIYPKGHQSLADNLLSAGGALVSEYPLGFPPLPYHFPQRNRLISGLSVGVLVVEAALGSGSLITAHCAVINNREVFAIPGSIYSSLSEGCHQLIQQGAKLVHSPRDIWDELPQVLRPTALLTPGQRVVQVSHNAQVADTPRKLLQCIGFDTTSVDDLVVASGLPVHLIIGVLSELEIAGYIKAVLGGYTRV